MSLSRQTVGALMDLIENKLSCMTVSDRDDLREKVTLQKALYELASASGLATPDELQADIGIPRRGRRRRIGESAWA